MEKSGAGLEPSIPVNE